MNFVLKLDVFTQYLKLAYLTAIFDCFGNFGQSHVVESKSVLAGQYRHYTARVCTMPFTICAFFMWKALYLHQKWKEDT